MLGVPCVLCLGVLCLLLCAEKLLEVRLYAGLFLRDLLLCDDSPPEAPPKAFTGEELKGIYALDVSGNEKIVKRIVLQRKLYCRRKLS